MAEDTRERERRSAGGAVSKGALLLGAAGLLLFIIGVKRRHRIDAERAVDLDGAGSEGR